MHVGVVRAGVVSLAIVAMVLLGTTTAVQAGATQLVAHLTPISVDPLQMPWPTGSGEARIERGSDPGTVCFDLTVADVPGFPPGDGGNAFNFVLLSAGITIPLASSVTATFTTGCISGVDPTLISDLFTSPSDYYVRLSELDSDAAGCNPCLLGAIQGQLGFPSASETPAASALPNTAARLRAGSALGPQPAGVLAAIMLIAVIAALHGAYSAYQTGRTTHSRPG